MHQAAKIVVNRQQFINPGAPAITRAIAGRATLRRIECAIGRRQTQGEEMRGIGRKELSINNLNNYRVKYMLGAWMLKQKLWCAKSLICSNLF